MSIFDTEGGTDRVTAYSGEIVDWFANENDYGTSIQIHTLLDNPEDFPWMADGIAKEFYNTGPGWKPENNGSTVVHETKTKFNANTDAGRLWDQLKTVPGVEEAFGGRSPYEGGSWKGLRFRFGPVEWKTNAFTAKDGTAIEAKVKSKAMPVEFLGTKGSPVSNGHAPAFDLSDLGVDTDTIVALSSAARSVDSWSKFIPAVIAMPGMPGSDVFAKISNKDTGPAVYAALKETI